MITLKEHLIRQKVLKKLPEGAIDLGLPSGTLWCSHNVGAEKPEDYGDYFAWGETEPKKEYIWNTYKFGKLTTKYNFDDNKEQLDLEDDAAYVNMGGNWHMPTEEQAVELELNTYNEWTELNGIYGRLFNGNNDNSIFIPSAGYYIHKNCNKNNLYGYIWFSNSKNTNYGKYMSIAKNNVYYNACERYIGLSVRGICNR